MCPHCQDFKPIYVEAAKQLQDDPDGIYILGEVNTMVQERLGKHFQIRGLPTVLIFSPINEYNPVTFNKNRTVFDLITEVELVSGLMTRELKDHNEFAQRFSRRNENILLGIFKDDKHPLYKEMEELKKEFNFVRMYYSFNLEDYRKAMGLQYILSLFFRDNAATGFVLMMHNKIFMGPGIPQFATYSADQYKTLKDFVLREYPFDVEFLNDKVEIIYSRRNLPRAVLYTSFANRTTETLKYASLLQGLGKKYKDKVSFYMQDSDQRSARKFKLVGDATYIIFDTDSAKTKYRYIDKVFNGSIDAEALIQFTQKFIDGKAPKYIRTAEVNKDDLEEPVYPVVAKTYDEVVLNTKKHVFLRFYDKMMQRFTDQFQMRKEWWKVARNYTNNTRDILIAEIEVNDNDILEYFSKEMSNNHYYFLFTKKEKSNPYIYKGAANATNLIAFAEEIIKKEEGDVIKTDL